MRLVILFLLWGKLFAAMHHEIVDFSSTPTNSYIWEKTSTDLFDELIVSFNSLRPSQGDFNIYVSVHTDKWSEYLLYATWGRNGQKSFIRKDEDPSVMVNQDAVIVMNDDKADGFRIKIESIDDADLSSLHAFHVCASNIKEIGAQEVASLDQSYLVDVKGLSQMALSDERRERLCSPVSTTAVVRYLNSDPDLNPVQFAESCLDGEFDIFGNWVFNVAEAYARASTKNYSCWVERHENFKPIFDRLSKNLPTVISVKGPLAGSALPYASGHLLVVIGYDHEKQEVICMDPAFSADTETRVRYKLNDLIEAWERRGNVAYVFDRL